MPVQAMPQAIRPSKWRAPALVFSTWAGHSTGNRPGFFRPHSLRTVGPLLNRPHLRPGRVQGLDLWVGAAVQGPCGAWVRPARHLPIPVGVAS